LQICREEEEERRELTGSIRFGRWPAAAVRSDGRQVQLGEVVAEVSGGSNFGKATTVSSSPPPSYHTSAAANSSRRLRNRASPTEGKKQELLLICSGGDPPSPALKGNDVDEVSPALETSVAQRCGLPACRRQ
jgi:hypothetical protein